VDQKNQESLLTFDIDISTHCNVLLLYPSFPRNLCQM